MEKENMEDTYNEMFFFFYAHKEEWSYDVFGKMDAAWDNHMKWIQAVIEREIYVFLLCSFYIVFWYTKSYVCIHIHTHICKNCHRNVISNLGDGIQAV